MNKLNKLITNWPTSLVYTTQSLSKHGYSPALLAQYKRNNWITAVGSGAVMRKGDPVNWRGALVAIQKQLELPIHVGALSALRLYGISHYIRKQEKLLLFGKEKVRLPTWFKKYDWKQEIQYFTTNLFKSDVGTLNHVTDGFSIRISSRERALFEQLYLVPNFTSFTESSYLFEGLSTLRADLLQKLLEECNSIKVKRLFMVISEELKYPWLKKLDLSEIDFGKGSRSIDKGGKTHSKYKITTKAPFEIF